MPPLWTLTRTRKVSELVVGRVTRRYQSRAREAVFVPLLSTTNSDYDLCDACRAKPEAEAAGPYVALGHGEGAL